MPRLTLLARPAVRYIVLTALLVIVISAVYAEARAQPDDTETVRLLLPQPESLDPTQISRFDLTGRDITENLFVGLTRLNPNTSILEPGLAESWSVSDDGLTWTFALRDDIQWVRSDPDTGNVTTVRPVVAGDFVYTIQRGCDPLRPSPFTANLMVVAGCQTVRDAFPEVITDIFIAREIGVRATGPHTLEIDLLFPTSYFPSLASTPEFRPLARESVSQGNNWTAPENIMTNGPFVLQSESSTGAVLVRNPFWPDPIEGNIGIVDITYSNEDSDPARMVQSGNTDFARLSNQQASAAASALPERFMQNSGSALVMLGYSYDRLSVDQPDFRRALAQAIDRSALVDRFYPFQADPANQLSPAHVVAGQPSPTTTIFDPAAAQQSLASAGFPGCDGMPEPIILLVPDDDPVWMEIGQFVIDQWVQHLECNSALFEVRTLSRPLMIEIAHSTYDAEFVTRSHVWLTNWSADYPDANAWLSDALHCRYGFIRGGRPCDNSDELLDQAAGLLDIEERTALYAQVESNFFGSQGSFPVSPLFFITNGWLQQPELTNVRLDGQARFDLWSIEPEQ